MFLSKLKIKNLLFHMKFKEFNYSQIDICWFVYLTLWLSFCLLMDLLIPTGKLNSLKKLETFSYIPADDTYAYILVIEGILKNGFPSIDPTSNYFCPVTNQTFSNGYFMHPPLFFYIALIPSFFLGAELGVRIVNTTITFITIFIIRDYAKNFTTKTRLVAFSYSINPLVLMYSSTGMLEPLMFLFALLAANMIQKHQYNYAAIAFGLTLLSKETGIIFGFLFIFQIIFNEIYGTYNNYRDLKCIVFAIFRFLLISSLIFGIWILIGLLYNTKSFFNQLIASSERSVWNSDGGYALLVNMGPFILLSLFSLYFLFDNGLENKKLLPLQFFAIICYIFFFFIISRKFVGLSYPIILPISILAVKGFEKMLLLDIKSLYLFLASIPCFYFFLLLFKPGETSFIMQYLISVKIFLIVLGIFFPTILLFLKLEKDRFLKCQ